MVQFKKGKKVPKAVRRSVAQGAGAGQLVTVDVSARSPPRATPLGVHPGPQRHLACDRHGSALKRTLTKSTSVLRNSRQRLDVGLRVPFLADRRLPLQLTTQKGGRKQTVRRFVPSADGPDKFTVRDLRWSFHYQFICSRRGSGTPRARRSRSGSTRR